MGAGAKVEGTLKPKQQARLSVCLSKLKNNNTNKINKNTYFFERYGKGF